MARRVYTDEQRENALQLYENDGLAASHNATGIPKQTIQSWAKRAGVRTSATQNMRAANEAAKASNADRRAKLVERLYGVAEQSMDLIESPSEYQTILKGEMGGEGAAQPGFIPAQDKQREMTAIGIMLDKAATLEKFDNDNGATEAKGLLLALAEQIGVASE